VRGPPCPTALAERKDVQQLVQWYHREVVKNDDTDEDDEAMQASIALANTRLDQTNSRLEQVETTQRAMLEALARIQESVDRIG
jgi:hypothetical protein